MFDQEIWGRNIDSTPSVFPFPVLVPTVLSSLLPCFFEKPDFTVTPFPSGPVDGTPVIRAPCNVPGRCQCPEEKNVPRLATTPEVTTPDLGNGAGTAEAQNSRVRLSDIDISSEPNTVNVSDESSNTLADIHTAADSLSARSRENPELFGRRSSEASIVSKFSFSRKSLNSVTASHSRSRSVCTSLIHVPSAAQRRMSIAVTLDTAADPNNEYLVQAKPADYYDAMLFSAIAALSVLLTTSTLVSAQSNVADAYVATESPIAKAGLLANIGPSGSKSSDQGLASGAFSGIVIASPSTVTPDYLFTWTRDSALTLQAVIDQYTLGLDKSLRAQIDNYVAAQAIVQQISNPSGDISTGGLGEPKFYINQTGFFGPWVSSSLLVLSSLNLSVLASNDVPLPADLNAFMIDGPALRSTALITWANFLVSEGNTSYVTNTVWPIIANDLNYVVENWNQSTFDAWEEVYSSSFFTTAVQHRALRQGAALAKAIGQNSVVSNYETQAAYLLCFLQTYWNPSGYITANTGGGRSGIDATTVLGVIHTFDKAAGCDALTFQPCSDVALSNLFKYVNSFRDIYQINSGRASNEAILTGRYPEDVYFNGNPWYLTTLAAAEQLYDALMVWESQGSLDVTELSLPFFKTFYSGVSVGTYSSSSAEFSTLTSAVKSFSDGFVAAVANYTPPGGGLSEQINKTAGTPLSAVDLTWSYASALTAFGARNGVVLESWGAKGLSLSCAGQPVLKTVSVTFNVDATTISGENIYLTGSIDALKDWSPENALALSSANYPIWSVTVTLPGSTDVQYKYIKKDGSGTVTWESNPNMEITTPANGTYTTNDTWR
ncbi:hypothetical protein D9757_005602 [Collybiopsis confluens]|uniref:glucan 1,4-alpha-glucosidase n=1 Tax=Collybiopsis confluens TaxID=2823264 RepID=A0A8H5MBX5_9AGAR|nr:hypothetical protein D9757_005602 [Collybiopsis confluens]